MTGRGVYLLFRKTGKDFFFYFLGKQGDFLLFRKTERNWNTRRKC